MNSTYNYTANDITFKQLIAELEECADVNPAGCRECPIVKECTQLFDRLVTNKCYLVIHPDDLAAFEEKRKKLYRKQLVLSGF